MGLKISCELETSSGPTDELYIRIDTWKINRSVSEIRFTTTSWLNKKFGKDINRQYTSEPYNNAIGLVSSKVICYDNSEDGEEKEIVNLYKFPIATKKKVTIPIYEEQSFQKEVPYISFNEEGEELTLYRTVEEKKNVKVGDKQEVREVIDTSIIDNLTKVSYEHLASELGKLFPKDKIIKD